MINSFEVHEDKESDFLEAWTAVADQLRLEPGFISAKLHESLDPNVRFRFVNVAEWESPKHFQRAIGKMSGQEAFQKIVVSANPTLYRVVKEM